ncbi:MAG: hypothetical protein QNL91_15970, partial [Candidatus Krumholzibacteria bacterium]|nr:hypothetical protein [Candidatus Krumholzibacteria bacterium]
ARTRHHLADALTRRLANQDLDLEGPVAFGPTMRMFRGERIVHFPAGLFDQGWELTEGAQVDSLDFLPAGFEEGAEPLDETSGEVTGQG